MSNENQKQIAGPQAIEWLTDQHSSVYSNISAVGVTPFDLSIIFGEVASATQAAVRARPLVKVLVSPEQASILVQVLQQSLKTFVDGNGPLRPAGARTLEPKDFKVESK
jgi:hypothetical protein